MPKDLRSINFSTKVFGDRKWPADMDELVDGWISLQSAADDSPEYNELFWAYECVDDLCQDHPDLALDFVLEVLNKKLSQQVVAVLAAGPLEEVLALHGLVMIDRVEAETRRDPKFRHLLGGVWRNAMTDDIWERVQRLATEKW